MSEIEGNIPSISQYGISGLGQISKEQMKTYMDIMGISTISASDKQAIVALFFASMPQLENPDDINLMIQEQQSTIVSGMLDKWSENLQEIKERRQDWVESPAYQVWLESHAPGERQEVEYQEKLRGTFVEGFTGYVDYLKENPGEMNPALTASFVIAAGFIGDFSPVIDTVSTDLVSVSPIQDAAANFNQVIPPDLRDELLLTVNFFATPLIYFATAETMLGVKPGETPKDLNFARNFADSVISKVKGNEINAFLSAILVNKMEQGQPISEDRISQMATHVKLAMLALALAVVYKAQTGWITGDEFAAMLKGAMELPKNTPEAEVLKMMQGLLKTLPADQRAEVINALMAYFDKNPSIDDMIKPKRVIDSGLFTKFNIPPGKA